MNKQTVPPERIEEHPEYEKQLAQLRQEAKEAYFNVKTYCLVRYNVLSVPDAIRLRLTCGVDATNKSYGEDLCDSPCQIRGHTMKSFTPKDLRDAIAKQVGQTGSHGGKDSRGWASRKYIQETFEKERGIWDEKSRSWIRPSGTVKQGRRPMFEPFPQAGQAETIYCELCGSNVWNTRWEHHRTWCNENNHRIQRQKALAVKARNYHDSTTQDLQEIAQYWKEKEGHCLGCNADIAVDEQYCKSCNDFLLETLPTHNQ